MTAAIDEILRLRAISKDGQAAIDPATVRLQLDDEGTHVIFIVGDYARFSIRIDGALVLAKGIEDLVKASRTTPSHH